MRRTTITVFALALVLALGTAGDLWAAGEGRMFGTVVDNNQEPIEGVKVTVTSPDFPDFREERLTKRRGTFSIVFARAYLSYNYRFEKSGYQTLETSVKTNLGGTTRNTFVLAEENTIQVPSADAAAGGDATALTVAVSESALARFNEGVTAFQAGDHATAEAAFKEALEKDPNFYQAHTALAELFLSIDRLEEAAAQAEMALVENSTDAAALRIRYDAYQKAGNAEKAKEAAEALKAAGNNTEAAKAIYNEGVDLSHAGDTAGALAKFQQAVQMDSNLIPAFNALATLYMQQENWEEAANAAEQLVTLEPNHPQALRIRVDAYGKLGEDDKLRDALVDLGTVDSQVAVENLYNMGINLYNDGKTDEAAAMFESALTVSPNYPKAHYYLGLAYVNSGKNDLAKQHLARFIELAPEDSEAPLAKEMMSYL